MTEGMYADIKPENILFRNKFDVTSVVISDFGLGRVLREDTPPLMDTCGTHGVRCLTPEHIPRIS